MMPKAGGVQCSCFSVLPPFPARLWKAASRARHPSQIWRAPPPPSLEGSFLRPHTATVITGQLPRLTSCHMPPRAPGAFSPLSS